MLLVLDTLLILALAPVGSTGWGTAVQRKDYNTDAKQCPEVPDDQMDNQNDFIKISDGTVAARQWLFNWVNRNEVIFPEYQVVRHTGVDSGRPIFLHPGRLHFGPGFEVRTDAIRAAEEAKLIALKAKFTG
jgi:hypothetical protein